MPFQHEEEEKNAAQAAVSGKKVHTRPLKAEEPQSLDEPSEVAVLTERKTRDGEDDRDDRTYGSRAKWEGKQASQTWPSHGRPVRVARPKKESPRSHGTKPQGGLEEVSYNQQSLHLEQIGDTMGPSVDCRTGSGRHMSSLD